MKRKGNLYGKICSLENLYLADRRARKGKGHQLCVKAHIANWEANLYSLHHALMTQTYRTSPYTTFTIREPKERLIFRLPYYPDRIVHWAVMNIVEPYFRSWFTADSYSCIRGRGIHGGLFALRRALRDEAGTHFCLKIDVKKFYPSVDHSVLKVLLRRKFKDAQLLWLLEEIIDSADGLPIGNLLSQYFANFYLTPLDRLIKETLRVPNYFRYLDDMVFLAPDKPSLHELLAVVREYLQARLHLELKSNYQVFPVAARGIDFLGYVAYHTHTLLRKSTKKNFARSLARKPSFASVVSYYGWIKHCNGNHLLKKLLHEKVQRLQSEGRGQSLPGRQAQDRACPQPGDHGNGGQSRAIEFHGEGKQPSSPAGFSARRRAAHPLFRILYPDRYDPKDTSGGIPIHYDHRQTE